MADQEEREDESEYAPSSPEQGFLNPIDYERMISGEDVGLPEMLSATPLVDPAKARVFDDKARAVYLRAIVATGGLEVSAAIAGVTQQTAKRHANSDKQFAEAVQQAQDMYKARIQNEMNHQAFQGDFEPITGRVGRDQDGVIGYQRRKNFGALKMLAQKHDRGFRQPGQGGGADGKARPSVLVVYPIMKVDDWAKATEGELLPKDPLHGIPGAQGLLTDARKPRGSIPDIDEE